MKFSSHPSQAEIRDSLAYDPHTGVFVWLKDTSPAKGRNRGKVAGTVKGGGYIYISLRPYGPIAAHRMAWIYVNGDIPDGMEVDHKDGDPGNNALHNLRLSTSSQQKMNKRVQSNNRSGLKGAYYHAGRKGKKWRSQIKYQGKYEFLGYHDTPEQAHAAYKEAAQRHYGDFCKY